MESWPPDVDLRHRSAKGIHKLDSAVYAQGHPALQSASRVAGPMFPTRARGERASLHPLQSLSARGFATGRRKGWGPAQLLSLL